MITLENKKYIKKELIILTVSMIISLSVIYICSILLSNKYGNTTYVSINHYFEIGDMVFLVSLIYFIMLAFTFGISNYRIFFTNRKTALSIIVLIPIWFLLLILSNARAVCACMVQEMNIPRYYLAMSSWFLVSLILYLIPTYYFRFNYRLYFEKTSWRSRIQYKSRCPHILS